MVPEQISLSIKFVSATGRTYKHEKLKDITGFAITDQSNKTYLYIPKVGDYSLVYLFIN